MAAHPACVAAAQETARLLESLGHRVEEAWPGGLDDQGAVQATIRIISSWTARDLAYWSERTGHLIAPDDVEPMVWGIAEIGRSVSAVEYIHAVEYVQLYARYVASWWTEGFDLLLTPGAP